jgi:c-di-GMP-binding flagellar brake protein YcgR
MVDKRKEERLKEKNAAIITIISGKENSADKEILYTYTRDISLLGARIRAKILLPVGTYLNMELILKDLQEMINVLAKVKWIRSIIENEYYEVGVEFINTPLDAFTKLWNYILWKQDHIISRSAARLPITKSAN